MSSYPTIRQGFVENEDESIYYEVVGTGDPIVLTHGYGGNHAIWFQQVPALCQRYQVITWDQRGFGRSTNHSRRASPTAYARDLRALLSHLDLENVVLVGQSMGGWTVTLHALDHPQAARGLVLADTPGGLMTAAIKSAFAAYGALRLDPSVMPLHRHPAISDQLGDDDPVKAFLYREISSVAEPPPQTIPAQLMTTSVLNRASEIDVPVLVIAGSHDPIFPPGALLTVAEALPSARYVKIPDTGHSPYFSRPAEWNRVLLEFLDTDLEQRNRPLG